MASEAIGQPVSLIVPPDSADEVATLLKQARKGEAVEHIEAVWRHKDGHAIDISVSVAPIRDASGTIIGVLSIAHDIGKRKRLERERTQHQQELTTRVLQAQATSSEWRTSRWQLWSVRDALQPVRRPLSVVPPECVSGPAPRPVIRVTPDIQLPSREIG